MTTHGGEVLRDPNAPPHIVLPTGSARVIVVGDPHGCYEELKLLLEKCEYCKGAGDVVVLIGDLVNKGPQSAEVVQYAVDNGFCAVCGNHDIIGLERWSAWCSTGSVPAADKHGDYAWVRVLRPRDVEYLKRLPMTITLPDQGNALLVHAGLIPGMSLEEQKISDMVMMRNLVVGRAEEEGSVCLRAVHGVDSGDAWAKVWDNYADEQTPLVIFGHDAPRGLQQYKRACGIDTNCCNGGQLTACILPSKEIVQVPALGQLHKTADGAARVWRPHSVGEEVLASDVQETDHFAARVNNTVSRLESYVARMDILVPLEYRVGRTIAGECSIAGLDAILSRLASYALRIDSLVPREYRVGQSANHVAEADGRQAAQDV